MVQERPLHKNKWMKQSVNANWLEVFKQEKSHETKKQWILTPDGILLSPKKKKRKKAETKKQTNKETKQNTTMEYLLTLGNFFACNLSHNFAISLRRVEKLFKKQ